MPQLILVAVLLLVILLAAVVGAVSARRGDSAQRDRVVRQWLVWTMVVIAAGLAIGFSLKA